MTSAGESRQRFTASSGQPVNQPRQFTPAGPRRPALVIQEET